MNNQWQNTRNGFDDCMKNLDENNFELSNLEVMTKFQLLKSILDNHDEIRFQFDFISEEYEKRFNQPVSARRAR